MRLCSTIMFMYSINSIIKLRYKNKRQRKGDDNIHNTIKIHKNKNIRIYGFIRITFLAAIDIALFVI